MNRGQGRGARGQLLASFIVLLAVSALGAERWVDYRVGPFHVISDAGDRAAREKLNQMEQLRYALGAALGKEGIGQTGLETVFPVDLVLFAKQQEYLPHAVQEPLIEGGSEMLIAWSADTPLPRETLRALTRMLIDENAGRMPDAIEQALCDLFSTIQVKNTHIVLGAPLPAGELQGARLRAWGKMQMLATLPDFSGKLQIYLSNMQQSGDEAVATRNAFDMTVAKLSARVDAYVGAGKFEAATVPGEALDPNRDFKLQPVPKEAVAELFQELAAGGKNFPPDSARGLVAQNTRDSLEAATKLAPGWAEPYYLLSQTDATSEEIIKDLKMATKLDPRNASYWKALAEEQAFEKKYQDAVKSWSSAERAAANDAERTQIHVHKMALDAKRADFTEAEKRRRAEDAARDLERVKAAAAAEIHADEAKINAQLNAGKPAYQKPVEWWGDPSGETVEGKLTRVDCLNGGLLRLTVQKQGGAPVRVVIRDLNNLTVHGASEAKFVCGVTRPARAVRLTYSAKPDAKLGTLGDVLVVEFP